MNSFKDKSIIEINVEAIITLKTVANIMYAIEKMSVFSSVLAQCVDALQGCIALLYRDEKCGKSTALAKSLVQEKVTEIKSCLSLAYRMLMEADRRAENKIEKKIVLEGLNAVKELRKNNRSLWAKLDSELKRDGGK